MASDETDVLVLGGGPAGSLTASILRRYNPGLKVTLVEKERFPRYHIGESLVLEVNRVLQDADALDVVSEAGFLRKMGATYVWGEDRKPWSFRFDESTGRRPHFDKMQDYTWHVDRARFDELLLNRARDHGVEVQQPAAFVSSREHDGRAVGAVIQDPSGTTREIDARYLVDATGRTGVLARSFGERVFDPLLRNIAIFGYWEGAQLDPPYSGDWDGATISIVTLPKGWLWYIPVEPGVVSVGVVVPREHMDEVQHMGIEAYYRDAVLSSPETKQWLGDARLVRATGAPRDVMVERDFNYLHSTLWAPGQLLVGDSGGFLDPLFTFGVFMAATSGQLAAYSLGTLLDGRYAGAHETRVLDGYGHHVRGYHEAFRSMLCIFYAFNSSKQSFWRETRALLRGQALPPGLDDREAFMALTFGYGVNTTLFHEATQHFGNVALNRIRDMCLSGDADATSFSDPGDYNVPDVDGDSRPRLRASYASIPSVVPIYGTGRVVPMNRVEFEAAENSTLPRHLYLPDEVVPMLARLDGRSTAAELAQSLPDTRHPAWKCSPRQLFTSGLRSLRGLGLLRFED